jgi:hypothetical protein
MKFPHINGTTRADRPAMLSAAREAVATAGEWLTGCKFFLNVSACLNFETLLFETLLGEAAPFRASLSLCDLRLSDESEEALSESARYGSDGGAAGKEVRGTLQIIFVHDEPGLRIDVPPIPG